MRQLGEQWIVEIDGVKHMVKAVKQRKEISNIEFKIHPCRKCLFQIDDCDCAYPSSGWKCDMEKGLIIKDLGILNGDGCLPSDFGIYPEVYGHTLMGIDGYMAKAYASDPHVGKYAWGKTKQEAIDTWNWRN